MANTAVSHSTLEQINSLSQLHIVRQIVFMVILAAGIALGAAIISWSRNSDYSALYMGMSTQDSTEVMSALEQSGIKYRINSASGAITVPTEKIQEIRLQLASSGLPRTSSIGYEVLSEEQSLGTSNFIEQARFNRALEQELVQTIKYIRGVRDARVHLSIPKRSSFLRGNNKPSASVMLDLVNLQSLGATQLAGIVHLVAASISGLKPEDVSIIDQRGTLLSQNPESDLSNSNENIRYARGIEDDYSNRILDILSPIVGASNVRTQVSADIDFTVIETTEEVYNPNSTVIRSEQLSEETSGSTSSVEPGALSSSPPTNDLAPDDGAQDSESAQSRTNSTRNYEIDHSVSHIRSASGQVQRLSVAVLIDLHANEPATIIDPESGESIPNEIDTSQDLDKIERLSQLVKDSIGFSEVRGDSVNIISERFAPLEAIPEVAELPIWQQAWVLSYAKQAGAGIFVLFLIFGVLRPALKSSVSAQSNLPNRASALAAGKNSSAEMDLDDDQVSLSGNPIQSLEENKIAPQKSEYDENLSLAQDLVKNEPTRAARMIKEWVAND